MNRNTGFLTIIVILSYIAVMTGCKKEESSGTMKVRSMAGYALKVK